MVIVIVNISRNYSRSGRQNYEVRLNDIVISKFSHESEEGMAECIRKAADSLEGVDIDKRIVEYKQAVIYDKFIREGNW